MKVHVHYLCLVISLLSCSRDKEAEYYPNGQIKFEAELKHGKRNGVLLEYYESGKLKSKGEWKNDLVDGTVEYYAENGALEVISNWLNGKRQGITEEYYDGHHVKSISRYDNGELIDVREFDKNGIQRHKVLYNRYKRPVYIADFDSLNNKILEILPPIFEVPKDTIQLGETYELRISFGVPLTGVIKLYTGIYSEDKGLIDTTEVLEGSNQVFTYSIKPERAGTITIPFLVSHKPASGDTLDIDGQLTKHSFYVIDDTLAI